MTLKSRYDPSRLNLCVLLTSIQDLERACVQPEDAYKLEEIGLALLKYVSSHRGLTRELFDEYTRRQYTAKSPHRNPFGDEDEPKPFATFDTRTKLAVLHQLSLWTLGNAERMRNQMVEKDSDEQTIWVCCNPCLRHGHC